MTSLTLVQTKAVRRRRKCRKSKLSIEQSSVIIEQEVDPAQMGWASYTFCQWLLRKHFGQPVQGQDQNDILLGIQFPEARP